MPVLEKNMTIEEYSRLPDDGPTELVRGRVVELNVPAPRHGAICSNILYHLRRHLDELDCGRALCNDSGIITERNPDTLRGADVSYYSYDRLPRGPVPARYLEVSPEIVFEVLSPTDRRSQTLQKVGEYLEANVLLVCVVDPDQQTITLYRPDAPEVRFEAGQQLAIEELLPGFSLAVEKVFE